MKAKKLRSGSWNVLVFSHMEGNKRKYASFTAPTKDEALLMAAEFKAGKKRSVRPSSSGSRIRRIRKVLLFTPTKSSSSWALWISAGNFAGQKRNEPGKNASSGRKAGSRSWQRGCLAEKPSNMPIWSIDRG